MSTNSQPIKVSSPVVTISDEKVQAYKTAYGFKNWSTKNYGVVTVYRHDVDKKTAILSLILIVVTFGLAGLAKNISANAKGAFKERWRHIKIRTEPQNVLQDVKNANKTALIDSYKLEILDDIQHQSKEELGQELKALLSRSDIKEDGSFDAVKRQFLLHHFITELDQPGKDILLKTYTNENGIKFRDLLPPNLKGKTEEETDQFVRVFLKTGINSKHILSLKEKAYEEVKDLTPEKLVDEIDTLIDPTTREEIIYKHSLEPLYKKYGMEEGLERFTKVVVCLHLLLQHKEFIRAHSPWAKEDVTWKKIDGAIRRSGAYYLKYIYDLSQDDWGIAFRFLDIIPKDQKQEDDKKTLRHLRFQTELGRLF